MSKSLLLSALAVLASAAQAQTNPAPSPAAMGADRPDFTEGTDVVGPGVFQIEGGYTYTRSGKTREHSLGEALLRIGSGSRFEWRLGLPNYLIERDGGRTSGFDDAFLGTKYVVAPSIGSRPAIAVLAGTTLPTGAKSIGENDYQPEAKLAADWNFNERTDLGVNLGYARASDGGRRFDQVLASASLAYALTPKWGSFYELYGFAKADATGKSGRYFDTGVSYQVNANLQVDARVGFGLFNRVGGPDYFTGVGASRRF